MPFVSTRGDRFNKDKKNKTFFYQIYYWFKIFRIPLKFWTPAKPRFGKKFSNEKWFPWSRLRIITKCVIAPFLRLWMLMMYLDYLHHWIIGSKSIICNSFLNSPPWTICSWHCVFTWSRSVGWLRDQLMISIPNVEWKETREQYIAYIKACCAKINQSYNNVFFAVLSQGASKHW